jgi:hypothetical protein
MNKEFVTYEQSLALKELGFDERCIAFYSPKQELYPVFQEPSKGPYFNNGSFIETLRAPLKQQTFRWFREKYKLISFIGCDEKFFFSITDIPYKDKYYSFHDGLEHNAFYETYEETEQACLDKLIEIVKESKS